MLAGEDAARNFLEASLFEERIPVEGRLKAWTMFNALRQRGWTTAQEITHIRETILPIARRAWA